MTGAVSVSAPILPAAAWYFPFYLYAQGHPGFALVERKTETQKKIKYRSAKG
jgi:hypothetical protein